MKLGILTTVAALTTIGLAVLPSLSQTPLRADLNVQLKQALCAQNWGQAIQVVDKMKTAAPQQAAELISYRGQLQNYLRTGAKIPNWPSDCSTANVTNTTPAAPTTTPTTPANRTPATPSAAPTNRTPATPPAAPTNRSPGTTPPGGFGPGAANPAITPPPNSSQSGPPGVRTTSQRK